MIDAAAEPHRYRIKIEERKTKLVFHNVTEADAGLYVCGAVYAVGTAYSQVELKVSYTLKVLEYLWHYSIFETPSAPDEDHHTVGAPEALLGDLG